MTALGEISIAEVPSSQVNFSFCLISSVEAFDKRAESDANQNQISPENSSVITPFE